MTTSTQQEICEQIIRKHSASFFVASRLLPKGVKEDARALYAWCRRADDAVDLAPPGRQYSAVVRLFAELDSVYAGAGCDDPVLGEFQRVVQARRIPRHYPQELLLGMEMDAQGRSYETTNELRLYCYRAAGTVGLMMSHVMGLRHSPALQNAAHLGLAMQLTNICRDVAEDWERGRMYLPEELLARHSTRLQAPGVGNTVPEHARDGLSRVVADLLDESERYYVSGDSGARYLGFRCQLAVRAARHIYSAIGERLRRRGCDVVGPRAHTTGFHKALLLCRAVLQTSIGGVKDAGCNALPTLEYGGVRAL